MSGSEAAEMQGPGGGHGEPVSFGLAFGVKTTVGAPVDFVTACDAGQTDEPGSPGQRQTSPVIMARLS